MDSTPATAENKKNHFTVHDPRYEALYCRSSFVEAAADADRIGCSLIVELDGSVTLSDAKVVCRYRKEGDQWQPKVVQS